MIEFTPPIELHKDLNPVLWSKEGKLLPDVHQALVKIAVAFYKFLETDATIVDLIITGSQSNYNYTDQSDLDLHLIIPFMDVDCSELSVEEYFETKRKLWKQLHNINIHGIPVEVYVEDTENPVKGAVYSIVSNEWIKEPPPPIIDYDVEEVKSETEKWSKIIDGAVRAKNLDMLNHVKEMLARYRQEGLEKDGEFGIANLTFKALRNGNKIKLLMRSIHQLGDDELSI